MVLDLLVIHTAVSLDMNTGALARAVEGGDRETVGLAAYRGRVSSGFERIKPAIYVSKRV
jgi:hypothetical protein